MLASAPNWTLIDLGMNTNRIAFLSGIAVCTLSLHDVCLNRLEPLKLRTMSCFVTLVLLLLPGSWSKQRRCFKLVHHGHCLVVAAPSHLSVVRYIGRKNCMELVCCMTKAIPALFESNEEEK